MEQFCAQGPQKAPDKENAAAEPEKWTTPFPRRILAMRMIVRAGFENAMFLLVSQEPG
jgi:hypothetical protein